MKYFQLQYFSLKTALEMNTTNLLKQKMSAKKEVFLLFIIFITLLDAAFGLYIKPTVENKIKAPKQEKSLINEAQWTIIKNKLGLTDQKVQLLKSQTDQKATAELIKKFMKENPKYVTVPATNADANEFQSVYKSLIEQLQAVKGSLKASLNFELADKSATQQQAKTLKRSPRKIAFKMVSDIPSEKIDDLLEMFSQQHGLNNADDAEDEDLTNEADYVEIAPPVLESAETDYEYENLWEDGEDPHSLNVGPQFGSFQDLFKQASRQRLQRESEELTLNNRF